MALNRLLNPLRLNADISLCCSCAAVLQESLNQDNVIPIGFVDLRGIPLAKAVGADSIVAQVVAYDPQLLLDHPLCNGEYYIRPSDAIAQAIVLNVLVKHHGDSKDPLFAGLLLRNLQSVSVTVPDDIT